MSALSLPEPQYHLSGDTVTEIKYFDSDLISEELWLELICGEKHDRRDYAVYLHICALNIPTAHRFLRVTPGGSVDACGLQTDLNSLFKVDQWSDGSTQFTCQGGPCASFIIFMDENGNLGARPQQSTVDFTDDATKFYFKYNAGYSEFAIESKSKPGQFIRFSPSGHFIRTDETDHSGNWTSYQFFKPYVIERITTV